VNAANAQQIGSDLIPQVLSRLGGQVNDPANNSIDINSVLSSLSGGGGSDLSSLLQKFQGGGSGDGTGGLEDLLKGFMK
jgi:hypothetical protein